MYESEEDRMSEGILQNALLGALLEFQFPGEHPGLDFLTDLSEYASLLLSFCIRMRNDWGDEADARMVKAMDGEIARWLAIREMDCIRPETVTDAAMRIFKRFKRMGVQP